MLLTTRRNYKVRVWAAEGAAVGARAKDTRLLLITGGPFEWGGSETTAFNISPVQEFATTQHPTRSTVAQERPGTRTNHLDFAM